uniref:Zinc finger protein 414 isoform X1 n=1 Tax=Pogona vitticeps TaxID=103695 RepID=A0ABM5ELF3_9SAUR
MMMVPKQARAVQNRRRPQGGVPIARPRSSSASTPWAPLGAPSLLSPQPSRRALPVSRERRPPEKGYQGAAAAASSSSCPGPRERGEDASPGAPPAASATTASLGSCHPPLGAHWGLPSPTSEARLRRRKHRQWRHHPGSNNSGLLNTQPQPKLSAGGGNRNQALRILKRRPAPGKRYQCSGDGCRLACRSMKELLDHMRLHYRPTQSLEGKTFHCSTLGCAESFPNMQSLMGHMKAHYKLNRYFKCENCTSRFRTHRSLFKHLHSCSDPATATPPPPPALAADKPVFLPASSSEKELPAKPAEEPPKLSSTAEPQKEADLPGVPETTPATDTSPADLGPPSEPGVLAPPPPHAYPLLEQSLFGPPVLPRFSTPPAPSVPGPFLPYMQPPNYALPQAAVQNRLRPFLPGQSLPVSNAVWKKSQGHSSNSRIVWEHTRGRYNCLQCPYSTASREEMTQHTEDHRKNPSPPGRLDGEMEFGVALPTFHPKLTPDVENTLFTPL